MTFFRPRVARALRRNGSIGGMEDHVMITKEWMFNVLGLLVLLALGVVS